MRDARQDAARRFYGPLADDSAPARRVGWESAASHGLRLGLVVRAVLSEPDIGSLVDVGCGEAALLGILRAAGYEGSYRGEDVLEAMIQRAAEAAPDAELVVHDALQPGPAADAVVACGTFNTGRPDHHDADVRAALEVLWARTRRILVLSVAVRDRHAAGAHLASLDLPALWGHARRLAPAVEVREDGPPGEALLVMRRDRRAALLDALPGDALAIERARIHLGAGEPPAARDALLGVPGPEAALWRAVTAAASGRLRDAEASLRRMAIDSEVAQAATLHLAALLAATRRRSEARDRLQALIAGGSEVADEARLVLARLDLAEGQEAAARDRIGEIVDPWVRREGEALLEELDAPERT